MGQKSSTPGSSCSAAASAEESSREPVIYLLGRSGNGKSSVIQALANQANRKPTAIKPFDKWKIVFTDGTSCSIVESHDIFENCAKGEDSVIRKLEEDLTFHKPCAILYVLSCSEAKSCSTVDDFKMLKKMFNAKTSKRRDLSPIIVVLTKADVFVEKRLWPVEDHAIAQEMLIALMDRTRNELVLDATFEPIKSNTSYYGYTIKGCEPFQAIIPTAIPFIEKDAMWNINNLHSLMTQAEAKSQELLSYDFQMDILELKTVVEEVKGMFAVICKNNNVVGEAYDECRKAALRPIVEFLENLIEKARAPIVYLMGRSGHGKSSLINALTNSSQAKVGHVKPTTLQSVPYDIVFEGQNTSWHIVDSRGIFESTTTDGAPDMKATKQVDTDLKNYKPDVILHVISCSEARNLSADLEFVSKLFKSIKEHTSELPPVIVVLSKADAFFHTMQWPIEDYKNKQKKMEELLHYMSCPILDSGSREFLDPSAKYYGCHLKGCEPFLYVIPVATLVAEPPEIIWNIDRLSELIGRRLPLEAWLHYYRTQKRENAMKGLALEVVNKITAIGSGIAAIPIPGISLVFLMPLYVIMISLIAKLAGREFSTKTSVEFLKTCKVWQAAAIVAGATVTGTLLALGEALESVMFGVGCAISIPLAAAATYGLGRAAIAYFFDSEIKPPESYRKEWKPPQT